MDEIDQNQPIGQQQPQSIEKPLKATLKNRLEREGRWTEAEPVRNELMKHARTVLKLPKDTSQEWTYDELNRRFPPLPIDQNNPKDKQQSTNSHQSQQTNQSTASDEQSTQNEPQSNSKQPKTTGNQQRTTQDDNGTDDQNKPNDEQTTAGDDSLSPSGRRRKAEDTEGNGNSRPPARDSVIGIGRIPASWPTLPANASLAEEIQWVQANRMRIVSETPNGRTRVHLQKALSPAPSHSTLGWLETSIRAYAKYCEIAAKASNTVEDGREQTRRERMKIDEVRNLLSEMAEA